MRWRVKCECGCGGWWLLRSDGWHYHITGDRHRAEQLAKTWTELEEARHD